MIQIQIKTIGLWQRELRKMRYLPRDIKVSSNWGQQKAAQKLVGIVKGHLEKQDLPWAPLAESTKRTKYDWRTLIESETYINNIKAFRKGGVYYAGVKRGVTEPNGIETSVVAAMHEFGSGGSGIGLPARPLWAPSLKEMGGTRGIRKIVMQAIARKLRLRGWSLDMFSQAQL